MRSQQERAVALIGLEDEQVARARARAAPTLVQVAADEEARVEPRALEHHGHHGRRRGLAVRARHGDRSFPGRQGARAPAREPTPAPRDGAPRRAPRCGPRWRSTRSRRRGRRADVRRIVPDRDVGAQLAKLAEPLRVLQVRPADGDRRGPAGASRGSACRRRRSRSCGGARRRRATARRASGCSPAVARSARGRRSCVRRLGHQRREPVRGVRFRPRAGARAHRPQPVRVVQQLDDPIERTSRRELRVEPRPRRRRRARARGRSPLDGSRSRTGTAPGSTGARRRPARRWSWRPLATPPDRPRRSRAPSDRGTGSPSHERRPARSVAPSTAHASRPGPATTSSWRSVRSTNTGRAAATTWSRCSAPWLPPITITVRRAGSRPNTVPASAVSVLAMFRHVEDRSTDRIADRLDPRVAPESGRAHPRTAIATADAHRASSRFARPRTAFGSCSTIGMCARRAARIGGTLT